MTPEFTKYFDTEALTKAFSFDAVSDIARRNSEAYKAATQVVTEGATKLAQCSMEQVQNTMQVSAKAARDMSTAKGIEELMEKQNRFTQQAFEQTFAGFKTMADIARATSEQTSSILAKCWGEQTEAFAAAAKKQAATTPTAKK